MIKGYCTMIQTLNYIVRKNGLSFLEDTQFFNDNFIDQYHTKVKAWQIKDTVRQVLVTIKNEDGTPFNLTGTNIWVEGILPNKTHKMLDEKHIVILDAKNGRFRFDITGQIILATTILCSQPFFQIVRDGDLLTTLEFNITALVNKVISDLAPYDYVTQFEDLYDQIVSILAKVDSDVTVKIQEWAQNFFEKYIDMVKRGVVLETTVDDIKAQLETLGEKITQNRQEMEILVGDLSNTRLVGTSLIEKIENDLNDRGINVKWYGAKGDAKVDDTQSFKEAMAKAKETGLPVIVPAGSYLIGSTILVEGVSIKGNGAIILAGENISKLMTLGDNASVEGLTLTQKSDGQETTLISVGGQKDNGVPLRAMTIYVNNVKLTGSGNNTTKVTALKLEPHGEKEKIGVNCVFNANFTNLTIENVYIGIDVNAGKYSWINGNNFKNILIRNYRKYGVRLTASEYAVDITRNDFDLQIESLGTQPRSMTDVFPLKLDYSRLNKFKLKIWDDWTSSLPQIAVKTNYDTQKVTRNIFNGFCEGRIDTSNEVQGGNNFSNLTLIGMKEHVFKNLDETMISSGEPKVASVISSKMIDTYLNYPQLSPFAFSSSTGKGTFEPGIDNIGSFIDFDIPKGDKNTTIGINFPMPKQILRKLREGFITISIRVRTTGIPNLPNGWVEYYDKNSNRIVTEANNAYMARNIEHFSDGTIAITFNYLIAKRPTFITRFLETDRGVAFVGYTGEGHVRLYDFKIAHGIVTSYNKISETSPYQFMITQPAGTKVNDFASLGLIWNGNQLSSPQFRSGWVEKLIDNDLQVVKYPFKW